VKAISVVIFALFAPVAVAASDPAADLCDRGGGGSRSDRARNIVRFHHAIAPDSLTLSESQVECVERRLQEVAPAVDAYCRARQERGHDLASTELHTLAIDLSSLRYDCWSEAYDRFSKTLGQSAPVKCSDLVTSYRTLTELFPSRGNDELRSIRCVNENLTAVASPVVAMCTNEGLSVRAALVEIEERMARACPGVPSSE
jgi:hypothetical protein